MGQSVGAGMLDVLVLREKNGKRETKVLNMLLFIKVCTFNKSKTYMTCCQGWEATKCDIK